MQLQQKAAHDRFEQMYKLFTIVQDDDVKQELQRQMMDSLQCPLKSFKAVETELYGASSSNPICLSDEEDTPSHTPLRPRRLITDSDDDDISDVDSDLTMTKLESQVRGPQPQPQHHPNTITITITIGNG